MSRLCLLLAAATVVGLSAAWSAPAAAAVSDFVGHWKNADPATRGMSQVSIRSDGSQLWVHAFGKCHPNDCDWGEVAAQLFTPTVATPVEQGANAAIVQFNSGATQTMLILQVITMQAGPPEIAYKTFTVFTDGSSRSNYNNGGRLNRW